MNFKKFINSDYLKENPLCGIDTYKDELNLVTGICTRNIKKLVLTGEENFILKDRPDTASYLYVLRLYHKNTIGVCSHLPYANSYPRTFPGFRTDASLQLMYMCIGPELQEAQPDGNTVEGFRYYLASQYAAGTPVTIWYVLAEPTTETITVPSGLSGTEEGYLIQDGTPTPTNPIYPTANTVEKWFDTNCYVHKTDTDTITTFPVVIYPTDTTSTVGLKGNTVQNGTPTPSNPVEVNGVGERTANLFDKSQAVLGKEIDGLTYKDSPQYFITGFIPVEGGKTYYKSNGESSIMLYYNADYEETVIQKLSVPGANYFTIPSGYNYIVLNALIKNIDNVMINAGSTPLPYEPYGYFIEIEVS